VLYRTRATTNAEMNIKGEGVLDPRFQFLSGGPLFINKEGELFSIIIAIGTDDQINLVRETVEGVEAIIDGKKHTSHCQDEIVMLNDEGNPTYLFYPLRSALWRIQCIATDRISLQWKLDRITERSEKLIHLRKSKLLPGSILSGETIRGN